MVVNHVVPSSAISVVRLPHARGLLANSVRVRFSGVLSVGKLVILMRLIDYEVNDEATVPI